MTHLDSARGANGRTKLSIVRDGTRPPQDLDVPRSPTRRRRPRPSPHLTPDEYVRLLAFIEDGGGIVTIDEISRAMPRVARPVSAVFDLCDKGMLTVAFSIYSLVLLVTLLVAGSGLRRSWRHTDLPEAFDIECEGRGTLRQAGLPVR